MIDSHWGTVLYDVVIDFMYILKLGKTTPPLQRLPVEEGTYESFASTPAIFNIRSSRTPAGLSSIQVMSEPKLVTSREPVHTSVTLLYTDQV